MVSRSYIGPKRVHENLFSNIGAPPALSTEVPLVWNRWGGGAPEHLNTDIHVELSVLALAAGTPLFVTYRRVAAVGIFTALDHPRACRGCGPLATGSP